MGGGNGRARPAQLVLELPHLAAHGRDDFLVLSSNLAAVEMIDRWPNWPHPALILVGPEGSGKTHLAQVWRGRSGATTITSEQLRESELERLASADGVIVENVDRGQADERIFFHLLNLARERGIAMLLTARTPPGEWQVRLPDLRSRLRSLPVATIASPDDSLLKAVLVKLFADRQLAVSPKVIDHIALRMERSMGAAVRLVEEIDRRALAERRKVTRQLAGDALEGLAKGSRS